MPPPPSLLREIHRRSIWQVLLIYVGASWAVIEAVQGLTEATGLPESFPAFAVGLLLIGFPIVMATAVVQGGVGRGAEEPTVPDAESAPSEAAPAVVDLAPGTGSLDRPSTRPPKAQRLLTWKNAVGGGVVAMALWGVLATAWILLGQPTGVARGDSRIALATVAVLPFDNMSPDEDNAFFAAGIHEDILTQLSKIAALTVISRTSVMPYAESDKSLKEIGDELGAGAILEGSVRRVGNQVRITTQLIDSRSDAHLWADTYDRELTDVFRIQMEIATHVARALEATLSPEEEARIATSPTANLQAYDIYLRGRERYNEHTVDGNREAIRLFREAMELDAAFALAWAGLGDAFAQAVIRFGYGFEYVDSAVTAAETAVRLGPELGEAHKALGLALSQAGRRSEAMNAYLRSAELNPSNFATINNIGTEVSTDGRLDEALVWYRRASRIAPNQEFPQTNAAEVYTLLGDFETADEWLTEAESTFPEGTSVIQQRSFWHLFQGDALAAYESALPALTIAPEDPGVHLTLGLTALWAGQSDKAMDHLRESEALSPVGGWLIHSTDFLLAAALIESGRTDEAEGHIADGVAFIRQFGDEGDSGGFVDYDLAAAAALRGDRDDALSYLEGAFDGGLRYAVRADDPVFASLHDDPDYQAVMARFQADIDRMRVSMEALERAEGMR